MQCGRYTIFFHAVTYEDQLPELTDEEYKIWYDLSYVDGVRVGPDVVLITDP